MQVLADCYQLHCCADHFIGVAISIIGVDHLESVWSARIDAVRLSRVRRQLKGLVVEDDRYFLWGVVLNSDLNALFLLRFFIAIFVLLDLGSSLRNPMVDHMVDVGMAYMWPGQSFGGLQIKLQCALVMRKLTQEVSGAVARTPSIHSEVVRFHYQIFTKVQTLSAFPRLLESWSHGAKKINYWILMATQTMDNTAFRGWSLKAYKLSNSSLYLYLSGNGTLTFNPIKGTVIYNIDYTIMSRRVEMRHCWIE
jgi:hypothetical protein